MRIQAAGRLYVLRERDKWREYCVDTWLALDITDREKGTIAFETRQLLLRGAKLHRRALVRVLPFSV